MNCAKLTSRECGSSSLYRDAASQWQLSLRLTNSILNLWLIRTNGNGTFPADRAFYDVAVLSRPRYGNGRITNVGHVAAPRREKRRLLGDVALLYLPVGILVRLSGLPSYYRAIKDPA